MRQSGRSVRARSLGALVVAGALVLTGCTDEGGSPDPDPRNSEAGVSGAGGAAPREEAALATLTGTLVGEDAAGSGGKAVNQPVLESTVALGVCGLDALPSDKERLGGLSKVVASGEVEVIQRSTLYRAGSAESALTEIRQLLLGCSFAREGASIMPKVVDLGVGDFAVPVFAVSVAGDLSALTQPQAVARPGESGAPAAPAAAAGNSIVVVAKRGPVVSSAVVVGGAEAEAKRVTEAMVAALTKSVPESEAAPAPAPAPGESGAPTGNPGMAPVSPPPGAPAPYVPGIPAPAGG